MASRRTTSLLLFLCLFSALLSTVTAQTFTACDPLKEDNCPINPALSTTYSLNLTKELNTVLWNTTNGALTYTDEGAEFTINRKLDSPTIQSKFYIFWGRLEVFMKAAPGKGVVSSIVLQSEDRDEIDWEWVGSETDFVQSNYFGKGNDSSFDRGGKHEMGNAMNDFHNYTLHWTKEKLEWWLDGKLLRTLTYDDAEGGKWYPQTPMNVRLGVWPGGDPDGRKGTIEWAGGEIDYDASPYTMVVKSLKVEDFSTAEAYKYGDKSGDWESIELIGANSTFIEEINKPPPKSLSQKWAELPNGAKIAVYASSAGVGLIALLALIFVCIKQRRVGRKEYSLEESKFITDQNNTMTMQSKWNSNNGGYQELRRI
ncbi:hypothetical protein AJ80_08383 [Polytolypa hystricis UAMH7299]|uniref:chitinase n=1 Tax=Polytolypa hystricis (strain UAMH7299) TaxID=1447883 RepID=A0A2B7X8V6_POLH7|nr:hypothetical protein AJ80_08383 [Polytolypa hystricis UAMH7299]